MAASNSIPRFMEKVAQQNICAKFGASTKGFSAAFRKLVDQPGAFDDPSEPIVREYPNLTFKPDAWLIDGRVVKLWEIEDSHPLSEAKLRKIVDLFWFCDEEEIELHCYIADRYGSVMSELELSEMAYSVMAVDHGQTREG